MTRHVVTVEARGVPTPARVRRQRTLLERLCEQRRTTPELREGGLRPCARFDFSVRTSREDAVAELVRLLDAISPDWRRDLRVWDLP